MGNSIVTDVQFRVKLSIYFCISLIYILYPGLIQLLVVRLFLFCLENNNKHFDFLSIYQNVPLTDVRRNLSTNETKVLTTKVSETKESHKNIFLGNNVKVNK